MIKTIIILLVFNKIYHLLSNDGIDRLHEKNYLEREEEGTRLYLIHGNW